MAGAAPKIVRIIAVRDTRDRIEVGDRWVPVPGSGQARPCDRCGREHEIHVDVELSDGSRSTIGQGCARGESMEIQARIKSAISAAKTRAKLAAELAVASEEHKRADAAYKAVQAMTPPKAALLEEIPDRHGVRQIWSMGDANVWTLAGRPFDDERKRALVSSWQGNRYRERGFDLPPYWYAEREADLKKRLATIQRKLETFTR